MYTSCIVGEGNFLIFNGCVGNPFTNKDLVEMFARRQLDDREKKPEVVVTLPETVFFAFVSADLSPPVRQKVDAIAEVLHHSRATQRQSAVVGHADAIGTEEANPSH